jgi:hypothetical protein
LAGIAAINSVVARMFLLNALQPVLDIPTWAIVLRMMGAIIAIIIVVVNKMNEPDEGPNPDATRMLEGRRHLLPPNDAMIPQLLLNSELSRCLVLPAGWSIARCHLLQ